MVILSHISYPRFRPLHSPFPLQYTPRQINQPSGPFPSILSLPGPRMLPCNDPIAASTIEKMTKKCKAHSKDICDVFCFLFFLVYLFIEKVEVKSKKAISLSTEPPIEEILCLFILRVHVLNERNAEFLPEILELIEVLLVLLLIFNFGFDACPIINTGVLDGWGEAYPRRFSQR